MRFKLRGLILFLLFIFIFCKVIDVGAAENNEIVVFRITSDLHYFFPEGEKKPIRRGFVPFLSDEKYLIKENEKIVEVSDQIFMPTGQTKWILEMLSMTSGYLYGMGGVYKKCDSTFDINNNYDYIIMSSTSWKEAPIITRQQEGSFITDFPQIPFDLSFVLEEVKDDGSILVTLDGISYKVTINETKEIYKKDFIEGKKKLKGEGALV